MLIWRSGSRRHDWRDGVQLRRLLEAYAELGLTGDAEWAAVEFAGERGEAAVTQDALPGEVLRIVAEGDGTCSVGGSLPHPWELHVVVAGWDDSEGVVDGATLANLRWSGTEVDTEQRSDEFFEIFTGLHGPDDSEFAVLHPDEHLDHLRAEVYRPPLVNAHMVSGACFATYVGPGQIEWFDADRLAAVDAVRVVRDDDRAVWIQGLPVLSEADTAQAEERLVALTEEMRTALR